MVLCLLMQFCDQLQRTDQSQFGLWQLISLTLITASPLNLPDSVSPIQISPEHEDKLDVKQHC